MTSTERELIQANATIAELQKNYNELIMTVASKFPNETRHQTALRYIFLMESKCDRAMSDSAVNAEKQFVKGKSIDCL